ncbi:MAG: hypothetical protein QOD67_4574, partial [Caballeronia sp.]|nr:hypothetical protein [Caballeronia sp.]
QSSGRASVTESTESTVEAEAGVEADIGVMAMKIIG